ncbi:hypothetical protein VCHE25_0080 [Vibrio cholerae HE-25]|nr:hypothetical protein VCHE25_0080 [Vibrio cholerae HE-25]
MLSVQIVEQLTSSSHQPQKANVCLRKKSPYNAPQAGLLAQ